MLTIISAMLVMIVILTWKLTRRDLPLFGAGFAVLFAGLAKDLILARRNQWLLCIHGRGAEVT